jgi:hypothetical protein
MAELYDNDGDKQQAYQYHFDVSASEFFLCVLSVVLEFYIFLKEVHTHSSVCIFYL